MQEADKKSILILLTNSFAAINIIHSGLIRELARHYNIYLLSTMIHDRELLLINSHYNINLKIIPVSLPREGLFLSILRKVEKALFASHFNIVTQEIKDQKLSPARRFFMKTVLHLLAVSYLSKILLLLLRKSIIYMTSFSSGLRGLLSYRLEGVISLSPLDLRENRVVNFLGRHGVKSLGMVISWDNLTSKGVMNADHSYTLVWNELMAGEFQNFYSLFSSNIPKVSAVGIPRFDNYFKANKCSTSSIRQRYNVHDGDYIILIATSAIKHFPNQFEVISDVLEFAKSNKKIHIIIRCHPADDPTRYESLAAEKSVTFWHSKNITSGNSRFYEWLPEFDFLNSLTGMLQICDVCVQFASTIKLDAAACGKPVISIAYDGSDAVPYAHQVKRLYEYAHQLPLNRLQVDRLVTSKQQLFEALTDSLAGTDPNVQIAAIKPFVHFTTDDSVKCTVKTIAEWLG